MLAEYARPIVVFQFQGEMNKADAVARGNFRGKNNPTADKHG